MPHGVVLDNCPDLPWLATVAVDFAVFWTCVSVLFLKKVGYEGSLRTWDDFKLDSSKQLIGGVWAWLLSVQLAGCADIWAGTMWETTIGVAVEYGLLVLLSRIFQQGSGNPRVFKSGEYESQTGKWSRRSYIMQLVLWIICVTAMKSLMASAFATSGSHMGRAAGNILKGFAWDPKLELLVVVLITPCCMRALQVWVTDDFLKKAGNPGLLWLLMRGACGAGVAAVFSGLGLATRRRVPSKESWAFGKGVNEPLLEEGEDDADADEEGEEAEQEEDAEEEGEPQDEDPDEEEMKPPKFCTYCGAAFLPGGYFCRYCGSMQVVRQDAPPYAKDSREYAFGNGASASVPAAAGSEPSVERPVPRGADLGEDEAERYRQERLGCGEQARKSRAADAATGGEDNLLRVLDRPRKVVLDQESEAWRLAVTGGMLTSGAD